MSVLPLTILITKAGEAQFQRYIEFLKSIPVLSTRDVNLILVALAQREFKDTQLITKLKSSDRMRIIIEEFENAQWHKDKPGYYDLAWDKTCKLHEKSEVIEQIQLRVLAERSGSYSVALNHLVNEFQAICLSTESNKSAETYKATDVIECLRKNKVPNSLRIQIRNLFDRRNINPLSHAGSGQSQSTIFVGVTSNEYEGFKSIVAKCLEMIL